MLIRRIAAKLNSLIINRRSAPRKEICLPITIIIPPERNPNAVLLNQEELSICGETKDLSEAGIAFFVSSIRLREHYLVSEERPLIARIDLPDDQITIKIVGVRYERETGSRAELKYLIGAKILNIGPSEKSIYSNFLRGGSRFEKSVIQDFSAEAPEN